MSADCNVVLLVYISLSFMQLNGFSFDSSEWHPLKVWAGLWVCYFLFSFN